MTDSYYWRRTCFVRAIKRELLRANKTAGIARLSLPRRCARKSTAINPETPVFVPDDSAPDRPVFSAHFGSRPVRTSHLMDDREGVLAARSKGLTVTGTLGVLGLAAQHGLLNLAEAFDCLKRTNFHYRQDIMDARIKAAADRG